MKITMNDLIMAYRKAKVDMYYTPPYGSSFDIINYEQDLLHNLKMLKTKIIVGAEDHLTGVIVETLNSTQAENEDIDREFLGPWMLIPKSFDPGKVSDESFDPDKGAHTNNLIFSSPQHDWDRIKRNNRPKAEFRIMAWPSIDFQVLSALWLMKIGYKFDACLSDNTYGYRLRLTANKKYNTLSQGSFKKYYAPYCEWRDKAIKTMRDALDENKKIVALTADASSFYHSINPRFMLDQDFLRLADIDLSAEEYCLHSYFISSLIRWSLKTPLKSGLPVGIPASSVVANMALFEFDKTIKENVTPLYYGRYVDDIILVMEDGKNFHSTEDVWFWLSERFNNNLKISETNSFALFEPSYLAKNPIRFQNEKNKVFLLEGASGLALVNSIEHNIQARASEWRAMPRLPRSADDIAAKLIKALENNGEIADSLRKTDACTMCRSDFSIMLRDLEAYERDLSPTVWAIQRRSFLSAFERHILVPHKFFDLVRYLPRVVKLASACEEFDYIASMLNQIKTLCDDISNSCQLTINRGIENKSQPSPSLNSQQLCYRWRRYLHLSVAESIIAAFPVTFSNEGKLLWRKYGAAIRAFLNEANVPSAPERWTLTKIKKAHGSLFAYDLAYRPFRIKYLPKEIRGVQAVPTTISTVAKDVLNLNTNECVNRGLEIIADWANITNGIPSAFLFPTRPFNLGELYLLSDKIYEHPENEFEKVLLSQRGFSTELQLPKFVRKKDIIKGFLVPYETTNMSKRTIAVASWKTEVDSWVASITRSPDPHEHDRYNRLLVLINTVISHYRKTDYLVLPELAIPVRWFMHIAIKLQRRRISFITGVEYLHRKTGKVCNQVWASLLNDSLGFPSFVIYRQDKQRPALQEGLDLKRIAGLELEAESPWKRPLIIHHGDFYFALLICSELTNIQYRGSLRGKVDAVFVPEWNQDIETFNALVESSALDIHAYIIQCNNRLYGDSRIRAPYKDAWKRDLMRVRGGINDYCVVSEIDIHNLRQFQSWHISPDNPFKPVPDGFKISLNRKMMPSK